MRIKSGEYAKVIKGLIKSGDWLVTRTKSGHFKLLHMPSGGFTYCSGTPNATSADNLRGDIKRLLRQYSNAA